MSYKKYFSKWQLKDIAASDTYIDQWNDADEYDDVIHSSSWFDQWDSYPGEPTMFTAHWRPRNMKDLSVTRIIALLTKLGIRSAGFKSEYYMDLI